MDKIILADYIGYSDNTGKPMGHPVKVINETSQLIEPLYSVGIAVPRNHISMIQSRKDKIVELEYSVCAFSANKALNLAKKWKNLKQIFESQGEDIVWFINVDFSLFLYLYFRGIKKRRIWINLCYNPIKNITGWRKTVIETVLKKVECVVLTNKNFKKDIPGNTVFVPDYYYNGELYDKFPGMKKKEQMVCLGTMGKEKKLESLITAMNRSSVTLIVCGNFKHNQERYEKLVKLAGENIQLENKFVKDDEYYALIANSKYVVLPYDMNLYDERTSGILLETIFLHSIPVAPKQLLSYNGISGIAYEKVDEIPELLGNRSAEQKIVKKNDELIKKTFSIESIRKRLVEAYTMKIVIFNTVPYGSTGRIASSIGYKVQTKGINVYIVNGWTKHRKKGENVLVATSFLSKLLHLLMAKATGMDGCFSFFSTLKLIRKLDKIGPNIVHFHIMHDYFLNLYLLFTYLQKKKIKIIWTFHDCWAFTGGCPCFSISRCNQWKSGCTDCADFNNNRSHISHKMWNLKRKISENPNIWITTPSEWLANLVSESFWHNASCTVIKNGLNLQLFHYQQSNIRKKIHFEHQYMVLGVAFDWGMRKGLDVFNELADILPKEYQIVLVGTNETIDKKINPKIVSIHKTENQEELVNIYSAADVFVNPTREEVFGMVNIEAIACGTPVVTFNTDGAPEGLNIDCGFVVNNKTAAGLLPYIREVCETNRFDRSKMKDWITRFDEDKCYDDYIELYNKIYSD